jgi:hypothetical protein
MCFGVASTHVDVDNNSKSTGVGSYKWNNVDLSNVNVIQEAQIVTSSAGTSANDAQTLGDDLTSG